MARFTTTLTRSATSTATKLNAIEPFAYLRDVLQRMLDGHPMGRLDDLLPWNWRPITPAN